MAPGNAEIFSVDAIRRADAFAHECGIAGWTLMRRAGQAVADTIMRRWAPRPVLVLCGPGNNGGDGLVAARCLADAGWPVRVTLLGSAGALTGDARTAFEFWDGPVEAFSPVELARAGLIIDAVFGAGLSRPLAGPACEMCEAVNASGFPVVAIDTPSGLAGNGASAGEGVFRADLTVTFHRLKPAHILEPGASDCGEIVLADIGIPDGWDERIEPVCELNHPGLWPDVAVCPGADTHKHRRGRLAVLTGGPSSTGAARMSALAGLRAGAGLVTLLSPRNALIVNAQTSTEVMVRSFGDTEDFLAALDNLRATAAILGPGGGVSDAMRERVIAALSRSPALVLDADALTSFAGDASHLFDHLRAGDVLTPHAGEFERLFPGLLEGGENRIDAAREAARQAGCVIVLKGPDTAIGSPDGRVRINRHASADLATAGTGDVLAGIAGAFLAQGADAFDAASAAVWLHGDAALRCGRGMIAGDLVASLPASLQTLDRQRAKDLARAALE